MRPVRYLDAPLPRRYRTWSESQPFLEWHSSARFPASRRTSPHVSWLMALNSLLMSRFSSVRSCGSPFTLQIGTFSQPQDHRLVCYEHQRHHRAILVRELQWHDDDLDKRVLHQHLKQVAGEARSSRWMRSRQLASLARRSKPSYVQADPRNDWMGTSAAASSAGE